MASYALLPALSGFSYSAVTRTLSVAPKLDLPEFRSFFSTASGWGTITLSGDRLEIQLIEGFLTVDHLRLTWGDRVHILYPGVTAQPGRDTMIMLP
jgi:hypothetical protein